MDFSTIFAFVTWITSLFYSTYSKERDREMLFPQYYFFAERRLVNHTIKTMRAENLDQCELFCYLNDDCVSLNIKKDPTQEHGTPAYDCELNNSTHLERDIDLITDAIFYYRGSKNACGKNPPCRNNATCQSGFTEKGYRCSCTSGFEGEHCEKDIDECKINFTNCHVNANCNNTNGSYECTCKPGYTGDGRNCTDIDECKGNSHNCHGNANCNNTNGSYVCTCKPGYTGDRRQCTVDVCQLYTVLEDVDRNINHETKAAKCDKNLKHGWYRFLKVSGIRMPTSCPDKNRCGTEFPGWLNGDHPTVDEGVVTRKVCLHRNDCSCETNKIYGIKVKNCGSFYVYNLFGGPGCSWRYCYTSN